jgi:hypothetical protein
MDNSVPLSKALLHLSLMFGALLALYGVAKYIVKPQRKLASRDMPPGMMDIDKNRIPQ